ncbi:ribosomal-processing cysteine protease Prp [Fusobacterium sp. SB021]|uniref:ribosomal-processing cysteine protease Prp n=1 Tax=Fusobacterium sp. SB021 TaxID=2744227 RepID=UPI003CE7CE2E
MTEIEILRKNGRIISYKAVGHAEYDEYGSDIVCAALSTALQFPLAGFQDVLEIYPRFEISSEGLLSVELADMNLKGKEREVNTLLESMLVIVKQLSKDYPKNIKLVEKEEI